MNENIPEILNKYKKVAVVGLSPRPERPSYGVAEYLKKQGYRIIPVNPNVSDIMGEKAYPDLSSITETVEIVDIFRRPEEVMPVIDEAIKIGAKVVWMQEGVINAEAARKAEEAGLQVVMDHCMYKEHSRLQKV